MRLLVPFIIFALVCFALLGSGCSTYSELPAGATNQYTVAQYCGSHGGSTCTRNLMQQSDPRVAHITW